MAKSQLPFGGSSGEQSPGDRGRDVTAEFVAPRPGPMTVSALVAGVKEALLDAFGGGVTVVGEISNFKRHTSGHWYFSLKDEKASIDCVMFRGSARSIRFDPGDGLEVVAEGRVDVWEKAGRLQLYVERLSPRGAGALELAFRQLKERLEREGLFEAAAKKPIARFPRAVGVVTSPTGAAVRDIGRTLGRRWPAVRVFLVGVRVQGESAAGEIAEAVGLLDAAAERLGIDTIIVGRGGGSLEDLWAFNEEPVARAIFAARTPIISAVGHETDFTIADFVADLRAATPTAAAELAVPDAAELRRHCSALADRLARRAADRLISARAALAAVQRSVVFRDPAAGVRSARQELAELAGRMRSALEACRRAGEQRLHRAVATLGEHHPRLLLERAAGVLERRRRDLAWALAGRSKACSDALADSAARLAAAHPRHAARLARQRVELLARQLDAMSYRAALRRGYSVTRLAGGAILRRAVDAAAGDVLETELVDGRIESQVRGGGRARAPARRKKGADDAPTLFEDMETESEAS